MYRTSFSAAGVLALFASPCYIHGPAGAKDGRDFSGYYSLTNVTEKGGQVEFTLALQLFNYSGADLKQAVVTVRRSPPGTGRAEQFRADQAMAQRPRRGCQPAHHHRRARISALVPRTPACRVYRLQRRRRARVSADGAVEPPAHHPRNPQRRPPSSRSEPH